MDLEFGVVSAGQFSPGDCHGLLSCEGSPGMDARGGVRSRLQLTLAVGWGLGWSFDESATRGLSSMAVSG